MDQPKSEMDAMQERYQRRAPSNQKRYGWMDPYTLCLVQERQTRLSRMFGKLCTQPLDQLRVLEVGCGGGGNLLELIHFGFTPDRLTGIELLTDRVAIARRRLPSETVLIEGDALEALLAEESFDIVLQSTVFTSILDAKCQRRLAQQMWRWLKPGGFVLWYDFIYDNPRNPDVRGVPISSIRNLFPQGIFHLQRTTLAPPIGRRVCQIHRSLYTIFNLLPILRSHVLAAIVKSLGGRR